MRGSPTTWSQPEGAAEPHNNTSIPQQEEQADTKEGKVIVNDKLDVDYKPEEPDPNVKLDAQE